ncbi:hypothetical protein GUJ93_ZPchr0010g9414 [Zizania palustris]|uniref:t-SNARE coiled-coil homology domain-containing protein n=1 Tax=Zizania palustris TaxID=103762 RepID=A0A8J6BJY6_ZIZPA|nr:hypothetical protein GUJ93_ZPchr0010g9414 [Zizania palustris]
MSMVPPRSSAPARSAAVLRPRTLRRRPQSPRAPPPPRALRPRPARSAPFSAPARQVLGVVAEIQERHGAIAVLERSLLELHQVFNDMAVLVAAQGEQLDDIESHVGRARSFVDRSREQLQVARKHQNNSNNNTKN